MANDSNLIVLQCINMAFIIPEGFIKKAIINIAQDQKCIDLHGGSCTLKALQQLKLGTKSIAPLYFVIHLVPMLLKYKKVARNPVQQIKKFLKGFLKSLLFVASTLFTIRRGICFTTEFYKYTNFSASLTGLICGFPLMLQSPGRQIEMALYTVNKSVEQLYFILRRRYPNLYVRYGQCWLFAVSAAILSFFYMNHRNYFRQTYQKTLDLFFADI